jgi:hypothetical protein
MENRYRRSLEKLAAEPPSTKTALVCALLPEIETALVSGKTLKEVSQRLADEGLDVTYKTFREIIRRVRRKSRTTAARRQETSTRSNAGDQVLVCDPLHDPLANLRRVEASRPGFHFRGTENLDVLVYGRREAHEQSKRQ